MTNWILRWVISGAALAIVAHLGIGVSYDTFSALAIATVVIGLVNSLVKPVVALVTLPLNCITLGIFGAFVNAALFWIAGNSVPHFHVDGWLGAVVGPFLMGVLSGILGPFIPDKKE